MRPMGEIVQKEMVLVEQKGIPMPASAHFIEAIQEQIEACRANWPDVNVSGDTLPSTCGALFENISKIARMERPIVSL